MKKILSFVALAALLAFTAACEKTPQVTPENNNTEDNQENTTTPENQDDKTATPSLEGRWNGYMDEQQYRESPDDFRLSYIFSGKNVDLYIIAWGYHYKGTFTFENNLLKFDMPINLAQRAKYVDGDSWGWWAGNMDPNTFELNTAEGYAWYAMDEEDYSNGTQFFQDMHLAFDSDTQAHVVVDPDDPDGGMPIVLIKVQ